MKEETLIAWLEEGSVGERPAEKENLEVKKTVRYTPQIAAKIDQIAELEGISAPAVIRLLCRAQINQMDRSGEAVDRLYEIICDITRLLLLEEERFPEGEGFAERSKQVRKEGTRLHEEAREIYEKQRAKAG